jgi:hypothetical protein
MPVRLRKENIDSV